MRVPWSAPANQHLGGACDAFDIMDRLSEVSVPTRALCGSDDIMTPPKYSHQLAKKLPEAGAVVIDGGTHIVFAEKPEEVNAVSAAFLQELRSRSVVSFPEERTRP